MTAAGSGRAGDAAFHDLVDELLDDLLDGRTPDLDAIAAARPELQSRLQEAYSLACSVAGRRSPGRPMLRGYRILRELGRGGMGTVYLAQHEELDREVALKVLPHSLGLSAHAKRRFLAEARALARLQHDHVVRIHRIVDDGELLAFEMEFVDGPSLQHVLAALRERGSTPTIDDLAAALRLPAAELAATTPLHFFVRLAIDIARALGEAHRLGIVHRDVKPSNILLQSRGRALLADFGLARGTDSAITRAGSFAGTPIYAAPEQLRGDAAIDGRADVYALAVTLYESIALVPPFAGQSSSDVLRRVETGAAPPLRRVAPRAPRDLETILQKAMEPVAAARYASADEFADDLQRLLDLQPVRARRIGPLRRLGRWGRRHRTHLLAGAAGAALVALSLWPVLQNVAAAETGARRAAEHVRTARQHLLQLPRHSELELAGASAAIRPGAPRHVAGEQPAAVDHLDAAIQAYGSALELVPQDGTVRLEAQVARLARWLRRESPERRSGVDAALASPELAALTAGLPPSVAELARGYVRGGGATEGAGTVPGGDRFAHGLLAFLVDDLRLCEANWSGAEAGAGELPLVDAILGMLFHADGRDERAFVRLAEAVTALPDVPLLRLELAEAALAIGEVRPGRELLALSPVPPGLDVARLELLRAELAPDTTAATLRAQVERVVAAHPEAPAPRHRLAQLAMLDGDWRRAAELLTALVDAWPQVARYRLDRARAALQQRDVHTWLLDAHHVLASQFGAGQSQGAVADLLQILRLGGFERSFARGFAVSGFDPATGRSASVTAGTAGRPLGAATALGEAIVAVAARLDPVRDPAAALRAWLRRQWREHVPPMLQQVLDVLLPAPHHRLLDAADAFGNYGVPDANLTFAHALADAGDVDRDGVADVLIGSPPVAPGVSRGIVGVVSGRTRRPLGGVSNPDATVLYGFAVAGLGDVDGDGSDDFVVGAPVGVAEGRAGLADVVSGATGSSLRTIRGATTGFGVSVAGLGDVDGDGCPDFAVGSSPELQNRKAQGAATVYSGATGAVLRTVAAPRAGVWFGAAVGCAGDVDADGTPDLIVGGNQFLQYRGEGLVRVISLRNGVLLHTWTDDAPAREFGRHVAGAGDVDGDGRADVLVTAPGVHGGVYVFAGSDGKELAFVPAPDPDERFGIAAVAGDLDGDGTPELIVGSAGAGVVRAYALRPVRLVASWSSRPRGEHFGLVLAWLGGRAPGPGHALAWGTLPPDGGNWLWRLDGTGRPATGRR